MGTTGSFPEDKAAGRKTNHSFPSRAIIDNNVRNYNQTPLIPSLGEQKQFTFCSYLIHNNKHGGNVHRLISFTMKSKFVIFLLHFNL